MSYIVGNWRSKSEYEDCSAQINSQAQFHMKKTGLVTYIARLGQSSFINFNIKKHLLGHRECPKAIKFHQRAKRQTIIMDVTPHLDPKP